MVQLPQNGRPLVGSLSQATLYSAAKSLTFSGLMKNRLTGNKLFSPNIQATCTKVCMMPLLRTPASGPMSHQICPKEHMDCDGLSLPCKETGLQDHAFTFPLGKMHQSYRGQRIPPAKVDESTAGLPPIPKKRGGGIFLKLTKKKTGGKTPWFSVAMTPNPFRETPLR